MVGVRCCRAGFMQWVGRRTAHGLLTLAGIAALNRWARAEVAASRLDSGSKRRDRTKRAAGLRRARRPILP